MSFIKINDLERLGTHRIMLAERNGVVSEISHLIDPLVSEPATPSGLCRDLGNVVGQPNPAISGFLKPLPVR